LRIVVRRAGRYAVEVVTIAVAARVDALDNDRVYPSGYSYRYDFDGVPTGTAYYYPQATRNAVMLMDVAF